MGIVNACWTFSMPPIAAIDSNRNEYNLGIQARSGAIQLTNVNRSASQWGVLGPTWFPGGSPRQAHEWTVRNESISADKWRAQLPRFSRKYSIHQNVLPDLDINLPIWPIVLVLAVPTLVLVRRESRRARMNVCRMCDYDLTANVSGRCPECGTPLARSRLAEAKYFCRAACRTLVLFTSLSLCGLMAACWFVTSFGWFRFFWHGNVRAEVAPAAFVRHQYQSDGPMPNPDAGLLDSMRETRAWLMEGLNASDLACQLWWYRDGTTAVVPLLHVRTLRGMTVTSSHLPFWVIGAIALAPAVLMALMALRGLRVRRPAAMAMEVAPSGSLAPLLIAREPSRTRNSAP